jgi:uncharacterized protein (DUF342 family)
MANIIFLEQEREKIGIHDKAAKIKQHSDEYKKEQKAAQSLKEANFAAKANNFINRKNNFLNNSSTPDSLLKNKEEKDENKESTFVKASTAGLAKNPLQSNTIAATTQTSAEIAASHTSLSSTTAGVAVPSTSIHAACAAPAFNLPAVLFGIG